MRLIYFILIILIFSCRGEKEDIKESFLSRRYDPHVIEKLLLYDKLRVVLSSNIPLFFNDTVLKQVRKYPHRFEQASYFLDNERGFRNFFNDQYPFPEPLKADITDLFNKIGSTNIYGFEIRTDSTLIVLIRNEHLSEFYLDVRERLSYSNKPFAKPEFTGTTTKDSILDKNWRYYIWYDKRVGWFF